MSDIRQNTPRETNELTLLSDPADAFKNPAQQLFIRTLVDTMRKMFGNVIRRDQASPQLILSSPNGTAYRVTVSDAGAITAAPIDRNDRA